MKKLIIGSINKDAGKTSLVVGLGSALGKKAGYIKPFGDRLLYRKKRLWDYDSALVTGIFGLQESPEEMSIGFEHAKLRYMYDENQMKAKLDEMSTYAGKGKEMLFVEGPEDLASGTSIHLDIISIAKHLNGKLIFVISGDEDTIIDQIAYIHKFVDLAGVELAGVIVNKIKDVEDFKNTYVDHVAHTGIKILGVIPYKEELGRFSVGYLADGLFAKVLSGESGMDRSVSRVFVGAMSADTALKKSYFAKEENKLVITSGDRGDMLVAALDSGASALVLTNDVLPPPNIISKASELGIPLLLVSADTYQVAKQIDDMVPLLAVGQKEKIALLTELVQKNVSFSEFGM